MNGMALRGSKVLNICCQLQIAIKHVHRPM